ncbi:HMG box protein [Rutstroemia sp. NJR-2017a WRK4]|nr:HMG box protein [Rutstroemia sp. NJR-2017a WRK4]
MSSNGVSKNPPTLPPSVEESYKRKCIELKARMNEVEEANDAARLRLSRMQRSIDKMRLERAFLLEQLAKRTSTNVEDSEGSPSPPPTPQEKPLRTKRGHRKPSFLNSLADPSVPLPGTLASGAMNAISPSSSAFSHTHPEPPNPTQPTFTTAPVPLSHGQPLSPHNHSTSTPMQSRTPHSTSLSPAPPPSGSSKPPKSGFDVYCMELRSILMVQHRREIKEGAFDIELALAKGWREMDDSTRADYEQKFKALQTEKNGNGAGAAANLDDDVEMADSGREEGGSFAGNGDANGEGAAGGGGFTSVNRS